MWKNIYTLNKYISISRRQKNNHHTKHSKYKLEVFIILSLVIPGDLIDISL